MNEITGKELMEKVWGMKIYPPFKTRDFYNGMHTYKESILDKETLLFTIRMWNNRNNVTLRLKNDEYHLNFFLKMIFPKVSRDDFVDLLFELESEGFITMHYSTNETYDSYFVPNFQPDLFYHEIEINGKVYTRKSVTIKPWVVIRKKDEKEEISWHDRDGSNKYYDSRFKGDYDSVQERRVDNISLVNSEIRMEKGKKLEKKKNSNPHLPRFEMKHTDMKELRHGFISPEGEFYPCFPEQHRFKAIEIMKHLGHEPRKYAIKCQDFLLENGWILVSPSRMMFNTSPFKSVKMTRRQTDTLFKFFERTLDQSIEGNGKMYPNIYVLLKALSDDE